jgi:hypothetical protein
MSPRWLRDRLAAGLAGQALFLHRLAAFRASYSTLPELMAAHDFLNDISVRRSMLIANIIDKSRFAVRIGG